MTRSFKDLATTDYIDTGLLDLLDRDMTALTAMSGEGDLESPPEDAVCDNTTTGVLKLNGDVLIDYKNGLLTSTMLSSLYQPLNSILTAISGVTISSDAIITTAGEELSLTAYGIASSTRETIDGAGALAKRTLIATSDIADNSITAEKVSAQLITTPVFNCGDALFSLDSTPRTGFLRSYEGYSVGSSTSSATYAGDSYFNLYETLWANPNALLRDLLGNITSKGSSASADFSSGKSVALPYATRPGIRFDYTGSVQTYTVPDGINILTVECIGAAGGRGGVYWPTVSIGPLYGGAAKGGYIKAQLRVTPGETLYIYVGGAGKSFPDTLPASSPDGSYPISGGYNGGGVGCCSVSWGGYFGFGSGGGMTDIRTSTNINDQILVAGGAGGSYAEYDYNQGAIVRNVYGGVGTSGVAGAGDGEMYNPGASSVSGKAGNTAGGGGGASYNNYSWGHVENGRGARGQGGNGYVSGSYWYGTGGGAGYYGGGAGLTGTNSSTGVYYLGSGGGLNWVDRTRSISSESISGYDQATGNGWVTITPDSRLDATQVTTYIKY